MEVKNSLSTSAPKDSRSLTEVFDFDGWKIRTTKRHIMTKDEEQRYSGMFKLPHLPDMLFPENKLLLEKNGFEISFNPIDALKTVNDHEDLIHVASSKEWLAARSGNPHANQIIHPFDWTFSPTEYRGTMTSDRCTTEETDLKINYEKLREQEKILFNDEVILYEDELDDNGSSVLSVKIRVMPSGFFVLNRFYLRVDNTMVREYDTRIHYELGKDYFLREYSERESKMDELRVPIEVYRDANAVTPHLRKMREITEKIILTATQ